MKKQQLFSNGLFFAIFYTQQRKNDVTATSLSIGSGLFVAKYSSLISQSISVQNLRCLTLKTKELWRGVENTLTSHKEGCFKF